MTTAKVGTCPGREPGLGHRFDVQDPYIRCSDCEAPMDALYVPGTYLPRSTPLEVLPVGGCICGMPAGASRIAIGGDCRSIGCDPACPATGCDSD